MAIIKRSQHFMKWLYCSLMLTHVAVSSVNAQAPSTQTITGSISIVDREGNKVSDRSDVVIFIDGLSNAAQQAVASTPYLMSHKDRIFSPAVLPIRRGEVLDFFNDDNIFHNVFSLSRANTFDLGIYPAGTSKLVSFDTPGLVKIYCNIHPEMISTILVLNNNLFAKTDSEGNFEIAGVPLGELTVRVWHEYSEEARRQLLVAADESSPLAIELTETKQRIQHRNKFGMPYREKY